MKEESQAQDAQTSVPPRNPRPAAATQVLAGKLGEPLLSSQSRNWTGLTLELHSFADVDTVVQGADHVIAIHLAGTVHVHQSRTGRARSRIMNPGDITITPVGAPTHWRQSGHSVALLLRLAPSYLRGVANDECSSDPEQFEIQARFTTRDPQIEQIGQLLLAGLELEGMDGRLYADAHICELAVHLLRHHAGTNAAPAWTRTPLPSHKVRRAMQYIDENLRGELTLSSIAEAVALSPGHFAHAFRQATGVAPHRYVQERRIDRAKELLRKSDVPITEIAHDIGCSSHSHFSVLFHRITGVTPREFRSRT